MNARIAIAVASILAACGGAGGSGSGGNPVTDPGTSNPGTNKPPTSASVTIASQQDPYGSSGSTYSFSPNAVTISSGGSVTWTNNSGVNHNVQFTSSGSPSNIGDFRSGTRSAQFSNTGSYGYYCSRHAGMNGTVTVQ